MNIYKTLNLLFIRIGTNDNFIENAETKYVTMIQDGAVFLDEIYTKSEIMAKYPDIKGYDTIAEAVKDGL